MEGHVANFYLAGCEKHLGVLRRGSEPVLSLSKERTEGIDFVADFPFMLRHSKHSEPFFAPVRQAH